MLRKRKIFGSFERKVLEKFAFEFSVTGGIWPRKGENRPNG
jgi:hypothetical protein